MTYFPQLSTGALSQYPIKKRVSHRTIANQMEDGSRVVLADENAASIRWELLYEGLSDAESDTLLAFFVSMDGRLGSFTFFDPAGNLAGWSETLTAAAWQRNSLLSVSSSVSDPLGETRASTLTNTGAGALTLAQELTLPGSTTCCWSFYARSSAAQAISLTRTSGSQNASVLGTAGPDWRRFELSSSLPGGAATSIFGLLLNSGVALDLFGFQVDAQPAASQYVQTSAAGGVFTAARFDMDEITVTSTGPNQNSCALQLIAHVNG